MAQAQPSTITAAPNAHRLRLLWSVTGGEFGGGQVGLGAGPLGDIYGPGTSAWAVHFGDLYQWRIYKGITGNLRACYGQFGQIS
jgi:hypothetical protein